MRKIGIIGGLGPEATVDYYRTIIDEYRAQTGGDIPKIIVYSLSLKEFPSIGQREAVANWLLGGLQALHRAGADFAIISANTPHIVFDEVKVRSPLPLLSIVEETGKAVKALNLSRVGLLGTKITMSNDFYQRVFEQHNISLVVPTSSEQDYIDHKISSEIMYNQICDETRDGLLKIIRRMIDDDGIKGLILGCTELPLILTHDDFGIPFLNTTKIHALSAIRYCMTGK